MNGRFLEFKPMDYNAFMNFPELDEDEENELYSAQMEDTDKDNRTISCQLENGKVCVIDMVFKEKDKK